MAMISDKDYAALADAVYRSNRNKVNRTPVPPGWSFVALPGLQENSATGFEAGVFRQGDQIVISFTGTQPGLVDWWSNIGLAVGITPFDVVSAQILDAARLYAEVKRRFGDAEISFTGHSLGGGLAGLMGVFFNKAATCFDPAPFRNSVSTCLVLLLQRRIFASSSKSGHERRSGFSRHFRFACMPKERTHSLRPTKHHERCAKRSQSLPRPTSKPMASGTHSVLGCR